MFDQQVTPTLPVGADQEWYWNAEAGRWMVRDVEIATPSPATPPTGLGKPLSAAQWHYALSRPWLGRVGGEAHELPVPDLELNFGGLFAAIATAVNTIAATDPTAAAKFQAQSQHASQHYFADALQMLGQYGAVLAGQGLTLTQTHIEQMWLVAQAELPQ